MNDSSSPVARHLEEALERSDPEEIRYHVRQAMQFIEGRESR